MELIECGTLPLTSRMTSCLTTYNLKVKNKKLFCKNNNNNLQFSHDESSSYRPRKQLSRNNFFSHLTTLIESFMKNSDQEKKNLQV